MSLKIVNHSIKNLFFRKEVIERYSEYVDKITYNRTIMQKGKTYQEKVLKGAKDLTPNQQRILEEQKKFDLYNFFTKKGASTGGIGLITPAQTIMTDTFIRLKNHPDYGDHGENVQFVYEAIYGEGANVQANAGLFQDSILQDGNILIQFCSDCSSIIWIPRKINEYQEKELLKLNERIKNIYEISPEYFDKHPMEFEIGNMDKNIRCTNNLDAYINNIENGIKTRH